MYYYRPKSAVTKGARIKLKHIFLILSFTITTHAESFKFSILSEPNNLQNTQKTSFSQDYVLDQLHSSFFRLNRDYSLTPVLAKSCSNKSKLRIQCHIKNQARFSDGTQITCKNFLTSIKHLIQKPNKNTERLSHIQGYKKALKAKSLKPLKVLCKSNNTIEFVLNRHDPQFLHNFTNYSLAPYKKNAFSGPYQLTNWELGSFITLSKNPHYKPTPQVSNLKIYFIKNPSVALKMYEKNMLDLLTYLPTEKIPNYQNSQQLKQFAMDRFDYVGIERLPPSTRKLIATSIDYKGFQKLYNSKGRPGCPALSKNYFTPNTVPCLHLDSEKKEPSQKQDIQFTYSLAGGADISKGMQFIKNQVEARTNLKIKLKPVEPGQFISSLKSSKTDMYRRGVSLQLPRCYEALEIFHSSSHRNYSKLKDKELDRYIEALQDDKTYCYKAVKHLLDQHYIVPLGQIHFSMLLNPKYKNLKLNSLNQLDLSQLETH